jgi:hypothetical protein
MVERITIGEGHFESHARVIRSQKVFSYERRTTLFKGFFPLMVLLITRFLDIVSNLCN